MYIQYIFSMNKQHVLLKKDPSGHHLSSMVARPDTERSLAIPCLGVSTNGSDHRKVDPCSIPGARYNTPWQPEKRETQWETQCGAPKIAKFCYNYIGIYAI